MINNWLLFRRTGVEEEGVIPALTVVTLLVGKKYKIKRQYSSEDMGKPGCHASIMPLIAPLSALLCLFLFAGV